MSVDILQVFLLALLDVYKLMLQGKFYIAYNLSMLKACLAIIARILNKKVSVPLLYRLHNASYFDEAFYLIGKNISECCFEIL